MFTSKQKQPVYVFHMSGGQSIRVENIEKLRLETNLETGKPNKYSITWMEGKKPEFFFLSLLDIIGVTVE